MIFIIYLLGLVPTYLLFRWHLTDGNPRWTQGDRLVVLLFSIGSWATFLAVLFSVVKEKALKSDKPAKW